MKRINTITTTNRPLPGHTRYVVRENSIPKVNRPLPGHTKLLVREKGYLILHRRLGADTIEAPTAWYDARPSAGAIHPSKNPLIREEVTAINRQWRCGARARGYSIPAGPIPGTSTYPISRVRSPAHVSTVVWLVVLAFWLVVCSQ